MSEFERGPLLDELIEGMVARGFSGTCSFPDEIIAADQAALRALKKTLRNLPMSKVETYLAARRAYESARKEIQSYTMLLGRVNSILRKNPEHLAFTNLPSSGGIPAEAQLGAHEQIDAEHFPSPSRLQDAILRYAGAREEARSAWAELPEADREGLLGPPS